MPNWIEDRCRRNAIRRAAVGGAIAVATLLLLACAPRYWSNFLGGPYPAGPADLEGNVGVMRQVFVTVEGSEFLNSGIEDVRTTSHYGVKTSEEHTPFWITQVGSKFLLVK